VVDFKDLDYVSREMVLVKLNAEERTREEILRMVEIFRGKIVDVSPKSYTLLITGDEDKIKAFVNLIKPLGIKEIVRTGPIAMARGDKVVKMKEKQYQGGEENG
jgi:acetolactate synthase-1/3 small subunit